MVPPLNSRTTVNDLARTLTRHISNNGGADGFLQTFITNTGREKLGIKMLDWECTGDLEYCVLILPSGLPPFVWVLDSAPETGLPLILSLQGGSRPNLNPNP